MKKRRDILSFYCSSVQWKMGKSGESGGGLCVCVCAVGGGWGAAISRREIKRIWVERNR